MAHPDHTERSELGKWEGIKTRGGRQKELVFALKVRVWELEAQLKQELVKSWRLSKNKE